MTNCNMALHSYIWVITWEYTPRLHVAESLSIFKYLPPFTPTHTYIYIYIIAII